MQTDSLSSSELANLRLPNLQVSRQAIEKRAKTQGWPYIEEVGKARGGRLKKYFQTAFGLVQSRVDIHPNNFILIK